MQTASTISAGDVEKKPVSVASDCIQATDDVSLGNGKTAKETVTMCKGPNGWERV